MQQNPEGFATVTLVNSRVIVCQLSGVITGNVVAKSMHQTAEFAEQIRVSGYKPLLLIDIGGITKQTSEARTRAKELRSFNFERIAVVGGKRPIVVLGRYIAKAGGMGDITHFFRSGMLARRWLETGSVTVSKAGDPTLLKRGMAALLIVILSIGALVGWHLDLPLLKSLVPSLKAMNPVVAFSFLSLALALVSLGKTWRQSSLRRCIVLFAASWSIFFGICILARFLTNIDTGIDAALFTDKLEIGQDSGRAALGAGILFLAMGSMLGLIIGGQRRTWQIHIFHGVAAVVCALTIIVLLGYSFGFAEIYTLNGTLALPLNTTLAAMLFTYTAVFAACPMAMYDKGMHTFNSYWQAIAVFLLLVFATGISWQQTKRDVAQEVDNASQEAFVKVGNVLTSRLATYTDALNGYKGLFAASSEVSPQEFNRYFNNSNLSTNYPGFNAITFAAAVPEAGEQAFAAKIRSRTDANFPQYKTYAMYPANKNAVHYPITYIEPHTAASRYGFDLSSEKVRRESLEKARDSGVPVASGIINLNAAQNKKEPNPGFFITLPVYANNDGRDPASLAERQKYIQGFVLAYFQNKKLFGDLLKPAQNNNAQYTIIDMATGNPVYVSDAQNVRPGSPVQHRTEVAVGGRNWGLAMSISPEFGKTNVYQHLPVVILMSGLLLSGLAGLLILGQLRRRDQAFQLAARMTEDLSNERNNALATQHKDEAILSSIGDAVFAINASEQITLFNKACEQISGFTAEEALGKRYSDILKFSHINDNKLNDSFIRQALAGHTSSMKNHTVLQNKDGKFIPVADSAAPIRDSKGDLLGAIIVFRDVSTEEQLDRAKTEFVSLASHQLRTPLSAINWYGELLLGGDAGALSRQQHEYIQEIFDGNQRMIDLVNALLDVSRLDLGKLSNQPAPTDMKEVVESIEKELALNIKDKKMLFTKNIQPNLPVVLADPKLLRMVVQNLLSNAVKYTTNKGAVAVTLRVATPDEVQGVKLKVARPYLFMSVKDTGYGIPKMQQDKIFSKLFRADNVRVLDVEGTGLGLYIVKEVVQKLGGRVWFTSKEAVGTTFFVLLPLKTKAEHLDIKEPDERG